MPACRPAPQTRRSTRSREPTPREPASPLGSPRRPARIQSVERVRRLAGTAWAAPLGRFQPAWLAWTTRGAQTVRGLVLVRSDLPVQFPTRVALSVPGVPALTQVLDVGPAGAVRLEAPIRASSFKLTILRAAGSNRPAVAIAELRGTGTPTVRQPAAGAALNGHCGDLTAQIGGHTIALRVRGTVAALDAGDALALAPCGAAVALPAAPLDFRIAPSVVRPLLVALHSAAPQPLPSSGRHRRRGARRPGADRRQLHPGPRSRQRPELAGARRELQRGWRARVTVARSEHRGDRCLRQRLARGAFVPAVRSPWAPCRQPTSALCLEGFGVGPLLTLPRRISAVLHRLARRLPAEHGAGRAAPEAGPAPPSASGRPATAAGSSPQAASSFLSPSSRVVVGTAYACTSCGAGSRHDACSGRRRPARNHRPTPLCALSRHESGRLWLRCILPRLAAPWLTVGALALLTLALFQRSVRQSPRRRSCPSSRRRPDRPRRERRLDRDVAADHGGLFELHRRSRRRARGLSCS